MIVLVLRLLALPVRLVVAVAVQGCLGQEIRTTPLHDAQRALPQPAGHRGQARTHGIVARELSGEVRFLVDGP